MLFAHQPMPNTSPTASDRGTASYRPRIGGATSKWLDQRDTID